MTWTKGTPTATSGNQTTGFTLVINSGVLAQDLLVLLVTNRGATTDPVVVDNDVGGNLWTKLANQNANTNGAGTIWVKYATSATASKTITVSGCTNSASGIVMPFRGGSFVSNILHAFGTPVGESNASTDESCAGITTDRANSMVLHAIFCTSNDTLAPGNRTATSPATITEDGEGVSSGGSDCSASLASDEKTSAGATGTISWSQTDGTGASISVEMYQDVQPTAIASAEGHGTAHIALYIDATSIGSAEAHGATTVELAGATQNVDPTAIASAEAHGTAMTVIYDDATAIGSAEAHGTTAIVEYVDAASVASAEAHGSTNSVLVDSATGISSAEAHGTAAAEMNVAVSGVASAETHGSTNAVLYADMTAIASAEAHGAQNVALAESPSPISSLEAHGSAAMSLELAASGIASVEAHGTSIVGPAPLYVDPSAVASAESHGTSLLQLAVATTGIASAEAHGTAALAGYVDATGVPSSEAHGNSAIAVYVDASAIASAEAHGTAAIVPGISPSGIASVEAHGTAQVVGTAIELFPSGVVSAEAFGVAQVYDTKWDGMLDGSVTWIVTIAGAGGSVVTEMRGPYVTEIEEL